MRDLIQVICENLDRTIEVEMGTSLLDIQRQYLPKGPHPTWRPTSTTASRN